MIENVKIYNEDCIIGMQKIPDGSVDFVLTDLPYGMTDCEFDNRIDLTKFWEEIKRVTKPNAAVALFSILPFTVDLINANRKMFRYEWIWQKSLAVGFLNAHKMPMRIHENILIFYRKLPTYNPQWREGKPYSRLRKKLSQTRNYKAFNDEPRDYLTLSDGRRYPTDILEYNQPFCGGKGDKSHPQQKPVDLLEYLIKTYTNEGEVVLDATMGSGSTGVAAVNTGRRFIGFELDEHYYNVANGRIKKAYEEQGLFKESLFGKRIKACSEDDGERVGGQIPAIIGGLGRTGTMEDFASALST